MQYQFDKIEQKWQNYWAKHDTFSSNDQSVKPKFYVLDMFPYPSGAGLHVGHPLGYIASDIFARYKRLEGFNVLHPMGYDSFGLPAEQYAIQTGQHPAITTKTNIEGGIDKDGKNIPGYRKQLDNMGFSFDWKREIRTSNPNYYRWTQWIFKQLFNSWYNKDSNKAEHIDELIQKFENEGNQNVNAWTDNTVTFEAEEWNNWDEETRQRVLMNYRLAYLAETWVNWCPELGTVLANDEVKDGASERGGYPVEQKMMNQWNLRITAYAERLLKGLDTLDWSDSIKDIQRNWIGKSQGASVFFDIEGLDEKIEVFTTRPDTIFGVSFMVLAPEHKLVEQLTSSDQKEKVQNYKKATSLISERERLSNVKTVSGEFTGSYTLHPFTGKRIAIWISDYVLASYGTGAVMAVPCGDQRDWDFAKHFNLEIKNIFQDIDITESAYSEKDAFIANSDFLNGHQVKDAIDVAIDQIEAKGIGKKRTQYKLRDAVFSRQRYWGEPFPVYYKGKTPFVIENDKVVELPVIDKYLPTETGDPPLARAKKEDWSIDYDGDHMEYNTMPGWAGSSWYFLRYMDPSNETEFVSAEKVKYWQNVDLYIGGAEHATGHLIYARFWTKFLFDLGFIPFNEPFQKMINQGMIQGNSAIAHRAGSVVYKSDSRKKNLEVFVSYDYVRIVKKHFSKSQELTDTEKQQFDSFVSEIRLLEQKYDVTINFEKFTQLYVDINFLNGDMMDIKMFRNWRKEFNEAEFIYSEEKKFLCKREIDKMSKSKYNVQTPDNLVDQYGADTLRCYEMFLGPLEQHKPWDTQGITGVHSFLKKLWRLFHNDEGFYVSDDAPTEDELKCLHKTIKKVKEDLERYSFNTPVSAFMILVNELTSLKCNKRIVLSDICILLSPYAPHISEELWEKLGNTKSISNAVFPKYNEKYLVEDSHKYPISFNGKMRFTLELPANMEKEAIEKEVLSHDQAKKWLNGNPPKKVIVVRNKIVNIVV